LNAEPTPAEKARAETIQALRALADAHNAIERLDAARVAERAARQMCTEFAIRAARAAERDAVVAWLRRVAELRATDVAGEGARAFAESVEHGDHLDLGAEPCVVAPDGTRKTLREWADPSLFQVYVDDVAVPMVIAYDVHDGAVRFIRTGPDGRPLADAAGRFEIGIVRGRVELRPRVAPAPTAPAWPLRWSVDDGPTWANDGPAPWQVYVEGILVRHVTAFDAAEGWVRFLEPGPDGKPFVAPDREVATGMLRGRVELRRSPKVAP
jgi:hypothetical protein